MNFGAFLFRFIVLVSVISTLVACQQETVPDSTPVFESAEIESSSSTPQPTVVPAETESPASATLAPPSTTTAKPMATEEAIAETEAQQSASSDSEADKGVGSSSFPVIGPENVVDLAEIAIFEPGYLTSWSRDGRMIVSMDAAGLVYLWNLEDWDYSTIDTGSSGGLSGISLSADNSRLASANYNDPVHIWDTTSGEDLQQLPPGEMDRVVAWSPDGRYLAIGACCGYLRLWDAEADTYTDLVGHGGTTLDIAWSPDGKQLATANVDSSIQVWDAATGERLALLVGHMGDTFGVAWSPDGQQVASCGLDGTVRIWDVQTEKEVADLSQLEGCVSWSPDGNLLASSGYGVNLWDTEKEEVVSTIDHNGYAIWSPDGSMLAIAGDQLHLFAVPDGEVERVALNTKIVEKAEVSGWSKVAFELPYGEAAGVQDIAVDGDGRAWFATMNAGVSVLDDGDWTEFTVGNSDLLEDYVTAIAIDGNGRAWIGTREGISVFDGQTWFSYTSANSQLPGGTVMNILFDDEGNAWISSFDGELTRFDGQEWTTYELNTIEKTATDSRGRIWAGTPGNGVILLDGQKTQKFLQEMDAWPSSIAVDDQDRTWIAHGQQLSSYDGETWTDFAAELPTGSREINHVAIAPDGTIWAFNSRAELFALSSDGTWRDYSELIDSVAAYTVDVFLIDEQNRFWFEDYYLVPPQEGKNN